MSNDDLTTAPRVGIAPDSWGVWNPEDPVQPDSDQYLREVQEAGYHWTEIGPFGYIGTEASVIADRVAAHDLAVSGGTVFTGLHKGADAVDEYWPEVAKVASVIQELGAEHLIVIPELWPRDEHGDVVGGRTFTEQEWKHSLAGHNALGKRLFEEFGLKQQFHSHAESQVGSKIEIVRLLENTDEQYLNLCLDTGHYAYYWGDSFGLIEEYPTRIGYLHLKQVAPDLLAHVLKNDITFVEAVQQGIMVEPPHGVPGYGPILEAAAKANPGIFAVIEQDMYPVGDFSLPKQIAIRTREYIEQCGAPVRFR